MELIKPGSNWDFMGKRKASFTLSLALVTVSLISLVVMGLNLGIDFKGGTKLIVAFNSDTDVERDKIRAAFDQLIVEKTKQANTQIEVQDFDVGTSGEENRHRFVIYTEITTLIPDAERANLVKSVTEQLSEGVRVEAVSEGEDKFYITFPDKAPVKERQAQLTAIFDGLGYQELSVESEEERLLEMEYYKTLNLAELDAAGQGEDGAPSPFQASLEEFEAEKNAKLDALQDDRFTVRIEELSAEATKALSAQFGQGFIEVESSTSVSASVGRSLLNNGLIAMLYALIGILLYIALRFDFRFSPGAVLALAHDSLITIGVFSLLQIKFSQPIIAALLTIIGYSLNDTIVVYDRIRENIAKFRNKRLEETINISINETLSRTVLTSGTTLFVVLAIVVLGGGLIRDFAFALLVGVVVGTYSSIFVASPFVLYLDAYFTRRGDKAAASVATPASATKS